MLSEVRLAIVGRLLTEGAGEGLLEPGNVLLYDLSTGYKSVFCLRKFVKMYT